jgi:hypothetical protein
MQNKLFISYNILWQEQVTFDDDDCVRFVIDQHTKLNFYSAEATVHRKTCRATQDMLSWFRANQYLLLLVNAVCLVVKQPIPAS